MTTRGKTEREIEAEVCAYAKKAHGALCYKFVSPGRKGVPDRMILFPGGRILFVEFKTTWGKPTVRQQREIDTLKKYRQDVVIINDIQTGIDVVEKYAKGGEGGFW